QVFSNLFQNAIDAMEGSGRIVVRSDVVKKGESSYCRVQVEDNGPGIASDHQGEVFNPYYTTKPHGTGLGLAIVERIMFDHQGQIWFETESGVGTTFFLDIPRGSG
ncbi:MAG: sensor histidine kinase, partial [Alkalispirochaetaceae bacterium]